MHRFDRDTQTGTRCETKLNPATTPNDSDTVAGRYPRSVITSVGRRGSPAGSKRGSKTYSDRSNRFAHIAEHVLPQTFRLLGLGSPAVDRCPVRSLGLTDDEVFRMRRVTVRIRVPAFESDRR